MGTRWGHSHAMGAAAAARLGEVLGGEACAGAARRCGLGGSGLAGGARVGAGWRGLGGAIDRGRTDGVRRGREGVGGGIGIVV